MKSNIQQFYCHSVQEYDVKNGANVNKEQASVTPMLFQVGDGGGECCNLGIFC